MAKESGGSCQCNFMLGNTFKVTNVRTLPNFYIGDHQKE